MADVPPERMKPFSPPFCVTGVDISGPFNLKYGRNKSTKARGALFTCATMRAIHLEVVRAFREPFHSILSPSPSTFCVSSWRAQYLHIRQWKILRRSRERIKEANNRRRERIHDFAVLHKMRWIFTTPLSPHQGGIYESLIKQTKRALLVAVGNQVLSWNEMSTVFAEVKSLVNSLPLGYSSVDPNDPQTITPNHLLLGRASPSVPHVMQSPETIRLRTEHPQHFWRRFIREYVPTQVRRLKWQTKGRQIRVGGIVLLVDYDSPRGKWDL